ncbi:MAG: hypothetical protein ACRDQY_10675 [Pseudonocardiaceae bacterium]
MEGCGRPHHARDLCRAHHQRWRRTGHPGPAAIPSPATRTCTVEGCGGPHHAKDLCPTHYSRSRRTGATQPAAPQERRPCGIPGCRDPAYRRGLCRAHYHRWHHAGGTWPDLDLTECARLYTDGTSATSLARLYGHTPRTILTALRTAGIPIRPPGHQPPHPAQ